MKFITRFNEILERLQKYEGTKIDNRSTKMETCWWQFDTHLIKELMEMED